MNSSRLASEADVLNCFRLILGRDPAADERQGHTVSFVGQPLESVVAVYLNSPEFKARKLVEYSLDEIEFVELDGYGLYVSKSDVMVGNHIRTKRDYEPEVTSAFREILRPGMRVIDVGANVGWFSGLSSHLVGPEGRVVAVEAGQANAKLLMMSRQRNGWEQMSVLNLAASDCAGTLLYSSNSSNGFVDAPTDPASIAQGEPVAAVPLGPLLEDGKPWHLIKIDVEGFEFKVLLGLEAIVARQRTTMLIEFSAEALAARSRVGGEAFLQWLLDRGYGFTALPAGGRVECGQDAGKVMGILRRAGTNHIDLLVRPAGVSRVA